MSSLGKWSLWIGLGFLVVTILARVFDLIPVTVVAGLLALITLGMAGYDVLYEATSRWQLRRRAARVQQEREQGR